MTCNHGEHFHVTIKAEVRKHRQGYADSGEHVSYTQEFDIPPTDFTGVAKILGSMDKAIGSLDKCKEQTW